MHMQFYTNRTAVLLLFNTCVTSLKQEVMHYAIKRLQKTTYFDWIQLSTVARCRQIDYSSQL